MRKVFDASQLQKNLDNHVFFRKVEELPIYLQKNPNSGGVINSDSVLPANTPPETYVIDYGLGEDILKHDQDNQNKKFNELQQKFYISITEREQNNKNSLDTNKANFTNTINKIQFIQNHIKNLTGELIIKQEALENMKNNPNLSAKQKFKEREILEQAIKSLTKDIESSQKFQQYYTFNPYSIYLTITDQYSRLTCEKYTPETITKLIETAKAANWNTMELIPLGEPGAIPEDPIDPPIPGYESCINLRQYAIQKSIELGIKTYEPDQTFNQNAQLTTLNKTSIDMQKNMGSEFTHETRTFDRNKKAANNELFSAIKNSEDLQKSPEKPLSGDDEKTNKPPKAH